MHLTTRDELVDGQCFAVMLERFYYRVSLLLMAVLALTEFTSQEKVQARYKAGLQYGDMKDFLPWMRERAKGTVLETCNTPADTGLTAPRVASRTSGTSFTINLGTFSTNPLFFDYFLVN
jgi:hypothetical protein